MKPEKNGPISREEECNRNDLIYKLDDVPPWYLSLFLALQHYITMLTGALVVPFILSDALCLPDDSLYRGQIISATFFSSGISTFLQATFGSRLPIIEGPSITFAAPILTTLSLSQWKCPSMEEIHNMTEKEVDESIMMKMREVSGMVITGAVIEVLIGLTGLIGFLMKFITPLTVTPIIALIGLSLFKEAARQASENWLISGLTMILLIAFSQHLSNVKIPMCFHSKRNGWKSKPVYLFKLFPVILAIIISWSLCAILTITGVFSVSNAARTDLKLSILNKVSWVRIPYPGQFGMPTFSIGPVLGVTAGVIASALESVGDYYACSKMLREPPIPVHAVNRGIMVEGIGGIVAGVCGAGAGTTSFSQNIGIIAISKVGSRRVIQYSAALITLFGMIEKFGVLFTVIPSPILGGLFCTIFAIIAGVGFSNLQYVNLNSSRNLFILGVSIFMGLCVPNYLTEHPEAVHVGNDMASQILQTLLKSSMLVGGFCGCILDNTIPASDGGRGILNWGSDLKADEAKVQTADYLGKNILHRINAKFSFFKYIPIFPTYKN